jgi:adenylate cyclase
VAANIGSSQRLSYALVGETVNIASRIQDLNKKFGTDVLLSEAVFNKSTHKKIEMRQLSHATVKGISSPLILYTI